SPDVTRLTGTRSQLAPLTGILLHEPRTTYPPPGVYFAAPDHVITSKFRMRVEEATVEGKRFDVSGCVAVRVRGPRPRDSVGKMPNAGDRVVVLGLLSGTRPPANPGEFDLARFYRRTGVGAVLWSPNWDAVRIVQRSADGFRHTLGRIRRFALRGLELAPDARSRAVLEAIVLGRRDRLEDAAAIGGGAMPEEQLELAFIKTGTAHFLAVSGLHVGMMAAFLAFVLRRLFVPRRVAAIVVIVFVMFYACLAQFRPSAVRAGIVISVMCLGWILGRRSDMLNSVAAAAILILLVSPVDLFMTGFQFSFLIMVGILFVGPELEKFFFRRSMEIEALLDEPYVSSPWYPWKRRIRFTLTSCTAAALLAIPLASYTFHVVVLWGPVISLFVLPLFYLILILAFGMILTGWWLPAVATLFGYVAQGFCAGLLWLLTQVSNIPYTFSYISGFSWPWLLGAYGVIVLWIWRERLKLSRRRLVLVALAFSAAFVWFGLPETKRDGMRVTFLAVGSANINV
ncbi:MAG: ComEC/Rec2 family competence protein, partial [Planctomycetia bacterium]|nr:ComEC/Rec2 family competence protein [Planctomycetia bacterium]